MKRLLLLLLLPLFSSAQVTFNHFYDLDALRGTAVLRSMIRTSDGGYVTAGSFYYTPWSEFDINGEEVFHYTNDVLLIRFDQNFNVMWSKALYSAIDFTYEEAGVKIREKPDGGFVILTETEDPQNIFYFGRPA